MAKFDPEEEKRMAQASNFYARNPYIKNLRLRVNSGSNYASGKRGSLADYHKTPMGALTRPFIVIRKMP
jgi:hypothetical protein